MYDPDAPSGSGFWHWVVVDIPASVTELLARAGDDTGQHMPAGAFQLPNDVRAGSLLGAAPPPGDGRHRYVIVVQTVDVEQVGQLGVTADSTRLSLASASTSAATCSAVRSSSWAEIPAA